MFLKWNAFINMAFALSVSPRHAADRMKKAVREKAKSYRRKISLQYKTAPTMEGVQEDSQSFISSAGILRSSLDRSYQSSSDPNIPATKSYVPRTRTLARPKSMFIDRLVADISFIPSRYYYTTIITNVYRHEIFVKNVFETVN